MEVSNWEIEVWTENRRWKMEVMKISWSQTKVKRMVMRTNKNGMWHQAIMTAFYSLGYWQLSLASLWPEAEPLTLLDLGHCRHENESDDIVLPDHFKCGENSVESLIHNIYPGVHLLHYYSEQTIFCSWNDDVDAINNTILEKFPGNPRVFHNADSQIIMVMDKMEFLCILWNIPFVKVFVMDHKESLLG